MLPNRPRLQGWDPGSLTTSSIEIGKGGTSVHNTVVGIEHGVTHMADTKDWSGPAHDAAVQMFGRASKKAQDFSEYAGGINTALSGGAEAIGTARTKLLDKATEIEQGGELWVNDQWVVLIKPAENLSAEKAADLEKKAQTEQNTINTLLSAVGDADDETAKAVQTAAQNHGYAPPSPDSPVNFIHPRPGDEVPNPRSMLGMMQQSAIRDQDMATTVREKTVDESKPGVKTTTITMMDGSKHVITEDSKFDPYHKGTITTDTHYDKNGNFLSETGSFRARDSGTKYTNIRMADGTQFQMYEHPDGTGACEVLTADGRRATLADTFFSTPVQDTLGLGLSGLEKTAERGIPMLSPRAVNAVGVGAKFGGPALGMVTTLYNSVTAETRHDACVEAVSGTAGVVGGIGSGTAAELLLPEFGPASAIVGGYLGQKLFANVGRVVGEMACPQ